MGFPHFYFKKNDRSFFREFIRRLYGKHKSRSRDPVFNLTEIRNLIDNPQDGVYQDRSFLSS
jgi:hypothetical protein